MKYKITIDKDECAADGICYEIDTVHYEEDDDGLAQVVGGTNQGDQSVGEFDDDGYENAVEAAENCPTECITVEKL